MSFFLFACDETSEPETNSYSIIFNSNGGTTVSTIKADEGASINKPANPTKDGFTFIDWYVDSNLSTKVDWPYIATKDITFYAKWEEVIIEQTTYTISWEVNGSIIRTDSNVVENTLPSYNGTPTKPSTAQYEYTFTGWLPTISEANQDQTYVAQFSESIRSYTISYDLDGASGTESTTQNYGTMLAEPTEPVKDGYHFVSWCLDSELTQEVVWPIEITQNQTLYAKWNESVPYGTYLSSLLSSYDQNPLNYIPESMLPGTSLITQQEANVNYAAFVDLSTVPSGGYGEQWNMVINNLYQSQAFFDVLTVVDTLSSASVAAFNNYLDSNPEDAANYEFFKWYIYNHYFI